MLSWLISFISLVVAVSPKHFPWIWPKPTGNKVTLWSFVFFTLQITRTKTKGFCMGIIGKLYLEDLIKLWEINEADIFPRLLRHCMSLFKKGALIDSRKGPDPFPDSMDELPQLLTSFLPPHNHSILFYIHGRKNGITERFIDSEIWIHIAKKSSFFRINVKISRQISIMHPIFIVIVMLWWKVSIFRRNSQKSYQRTREPRGSCSHYIQRLIMIQIIYVPLVTEVSNSPPHFKSRVSVIYSVGGKRRRP